MQKNVSKFGALARHYDAVRPEYPEKVIHTIRKRIRITSPSILDLGCGTGISTRQLARAGARVVGCDIDAGMLKIAVRHGGKNIKYVRRRTDALPFPNNAFDAVTAFTAFHWFTDKKSIREIRRVLKPGGMLAIVQPDHTASWMKDSELRKTLNRYFPTRKAPQYDTRPFIDVIRSAHFKKIKVSKIKKVHKYRLSDYMILIQSYSVWNQVPPSKRRSTVALLKKQFRAHLKTGLIYDPVEIMILTAER